MQQMTFIADLIACSTCFGHHYAHHQELDSITQVVMSVVFGALVFKLTVWCGAEGYVSDLRAAAQIRQAATTCIILELLMIGIMVTETC